MKRLALAVAFLAALASGALANNGSISLFVIPEGSTDPVCSFQLDPLNAGFDQFAVNIYYSKNDGPELGRAAEFSVSMSTANAVISDVTWSPAIVLTLGDIAGGISITGQQCLGTGQTLVFLGTMSIQDLGETGRFTFNVNPDPNAVPTPGIFILLCDSGNTVFGVTGGTFVVNGTCNVAVEKKTWGSIKELYH